MYCVSGRARWKNEDCEVKRGTRSRRVPLRCTLSELLCGRVGETTFAIRVRRKKGSVETCLNSPKPILRVRLYRKSCRFRVQDEV